MKRSVSEHPTLECDYCHQEQDSTRYRPRADAVLCRDCWADVQEGMATP